MLQARLGMARTHLVAARRRRRMQTMRRAPRQAPIPGKLFARCLLAGCRTSCWPAIVLAGLHHSGRMLESASQLVQA